jgi:hypothetical protein
LGFPDGLIGSSNSFKAFSSILDIHRVFQNIQTVVSTRETRFSVALGLKYVDVDDSL